MRRVLAIGFLAASGVAGVAVSAHAGSSASATVLIRNQVRGCHSWSVNGGPFAAARKLQLRRGGSVLFINDDVTPHQLVQTAGPAVAMRNGSTMPMGGWMMGANSLPGLMNHMGASTGVTFPRPGVYRFRTHAGEDYMNGFRTVGNDNQLTLAVVVR